MDWLNRFTGKKEPKPSPHPNPKQKPPPISSQDLLPDLPNYDPEPADGVRVGESPVPGLTLKRILRGHTGQINRIAWSPDGQFLASASNDKTIRLWNVDTGKPTVILTGHSHKVNCIVWSTNSQELVSASSDGTIAFWETYTGKQIIKLVVHKSLPIENAWEAQDWAKMVIGIAWSPDSSIIAYNTDNNILLMKATSQETIQTLKGHKNRVWSLRWSPNGKILASGSTDQTIKLWNPNNGKIIWDIKDLKSPVVNVAWAPQGTLLISASKDSTIHIWDIVKKRQLGVLEGHSNIITSVGFSSDGQVIASKSHDGSIRLWRGDTWEMIGQLSETTNDECVFYADLAFHPHLPILASLGENNTVIRIWDLDMDTLLGQTTTDSVRYTTAKLVLVGDSGVGKTGLGWRLAHGEFKEHPSTHGQQFWVVDELGQTQDDGTECEAVLWDLAGQPIYRHGHPLFLDNVNLSLLLFDPTKGVESLNGVEFWINQLSGKDELPPSVLVGARVDVGDSILTQDEVDQFCQRYGISGGYISTSAKENVNIEALLTLLKDNIPWESMTTTVTTVTFKRIKDYVLSLKEQPERTNVLVSPAELRAEIETAWQAGASPFDAHSTSSGQSEQTDKERAEWHFTNAEMMTAIGHLENHGYVTILRTSAGEQTILLSPDLLVNLVSSIILQANRHPRNLGSLNETTLLNGGYPFAELETLSGAEQETLSDAAILRFVEHNICFRETLGAENLLIFPGLIQQKRPLFDDFDTIDDVSYIIRGAVENVYSALVVLLGYTQTFTRVNQWQNQAQYEMGPGEICGFRQIEERAGETEFILYYATTTPIYARTLFQGLFEKFLYQRDVEVRRYPPVHCVNKHLQERATVIKQLRQRKDFIFCSDCGEKVMLPKIDEPQALGERNRQSVARAEHLAQLRRKYEMHLSNVKSFRRDRAAPRCWVSHLPAQASWVASLIDDLHNAGVHVIDNPAQVEADDFILLAATSAYKQAWQRRDLVIATDITLAKPRLKQTRRRSTIIPLLLEHDTGTAQPQDFRGVQPGDFRDPARHVLTLYDLVLTLYAIPFNHPAFAPLRQDLRRQWHDTLAGLQEIRPEIFISYAAGAESEALADAVDQAFQDQGVLIVRDTRDLGFKGSIKAFMEQIGTGQCVILIINEAYLKSANGCYELVHIARNGDFYDRIFPIIMPDTKITDAVERVRYVKHWEDKRDELDHLMKSVSTANMEGFRDDIDLYTDIRALLPDLMNILRRMNTLTPDIHLQSDFTELCTAVMTRLDNEAAQ